MNNQIYEICENFDFTSLKLDNPTLLNANIYFSKLNSNLKNITAEDLEKLSEGMEELTPGIASKLEKIATGEE